MGEAVQKKKKNENEKNPDGGAGKKKEENPLTVILKVDMHCEGCANKIIKCVKGFEGVQSVKAEIEGNKLTVMGKKIDATRLKEKLSNKTKKKVDLVSPQPKKEKEKDSKPKINEDDDQTSCDINKSDKKSDENKKKPKEPLVTTAVLKVSLHCQGCIEKIQRVTSKFKGVQEMSVDKQKDLVTVKGTMDVKALSVGLTERLKRSVEIVPMKKEKDKDNNKNGNKEDAATGNDEKSNSAESGANGNGNGGGKKKKKGGNGNGNGGGGGDGDEGGIGKMEGNKMEYNMGMGGIGYGYGFGLNAGFGYGVGHGYGYEYGPGGIVGENLHAPQMFSDENPNACSIM